jgi:DNA-binding SARP family transcriptional activator
VAPNPSLRVYLAGDVFVERGASLVRAERFPGLQGRVLFAMLAVADGAVHADELIDELWGATPPRAVSVALRSLVSKVRSALAGAGIDAALVDHVDDGYRWRRPSGCWVDLAAAHDAVHRADTAFMADDLDATIAWARVASAIASRPLLPGAEGPWATGRRRELTWTHLRALDRLAETWLVVGAHDQAARDALRASTIDPFREPSRRLAMRALVAGGDRAGALREYERFRHLMREALGTDPSPETRELHVAILRGVAV